jgi:hypothetical protein
MPKQRHGSLVMVKAGVYRSMALAPLAMGGSDSPVLPDHTISKDTHGLWLGKAMHDPDFHIVAIGVGENETVEIAVPPEAYTISS